MKQLVLFSFLLGAISLNLGFDGGHTVGNGGNAFDLMIKDSCSRAAIIVLQYQEDTPLSEEDTVNAFLSENKYALATNILNCDFRFTDMETPIDHPHAAKSCALTNVSAEEYPEGGGDKDTVYFSRTTCATQNITEELAIKILIHEAVHHFVDPKLSSRADRRIDDEEFCDNVAFEVYSQWLKIKNSMPRRWNPKPTLIQSPSKRAQHTAVWTGTNNSLNSINQKMLIWGGCSPSENSIIECGQYFNDGGIYDQKNNQWSPIETNGAPAARTLHTAVWTGSDTHRLADSAINEKMIVWGGCSGGEACSESYNDGGIYDLKRHTWRPVMAPADFAFKSRVYHTSIWTPHGMLIFGGLHGYKNRNIPLEALGSGAIYSPARTPQNDLWKKISVVDAPSPRMNHTAVWTGKYMVIWGGCDPKGIFYSSCRETKNDGGRYDPVKDRWLPISMEGAPSPRRWHTAVWTGRYMIVWGGQNKNYYENTGGIYDPEEDRWYPMNHSAPEARSRHIAVWTGHKMLIWGGSYREGSLDKFSSQIGEYFIDIDSETGGYWKQPSVSGNPKPTRDLTGVWTREGLIVWGGVTHDDNFFGSGGTYIAPMFD